MSDDCGLLASIKEESTKNTYGPALPNLHSARSVPGQCVEALSGGQGEDGAQGQHHSVLMEEWVPQGWHPEEEPRVPNSRDTLYLAQEK